MSTWYGGDDVDFDKDDAREIRGEKNDVRHEARTTTLSDSAPSPSCPKLRGKILQNASATSSTRDICFVPSNATISLTASCATPARRGHHIRSDTAIIRAAQVPFNILCTQGRTSWELLQAVESWSFGYAVRIEARNNARAMYHRDAQRLN